VFSVSDLRCGELESWDAVADVNLDSPRLLDSNLDPSDRGQRVL